MVVIKKISNIIPVDFGEFQLEYVANDENIKRMKTIGQNLEKRAKRLEEAAIRGIVSEFENRNSEQAIKKYLEG